MNKELCSIDDCANPAKCRGWCNKHYARWHKHGDPNHVTPRPTPPCRLEGCDRPNKAKGYCDLHYSRLRATGDAGGPELLRGTNLGKCTIEGCDRDWYARDWCSTHYQRNLIHGDPEYVRPAEIVDLPDGTRVCTGCNERKPIEDYYRHPTEHGGRQRRCKECSKAAVMDRYNGDKGRHRESYRKRYRENIDSIREQDRRRYERDKPKRLALAKEHAHKRRMRIASSTRDRGITDTALRERDGDLCCYCDKVMSFEIIEGHKFNPDRATIEHVTPLSQGGTHTWDNTALCCWLCNVRRGVSDVDEYISSVKKLAG